ncbi:rolling pebbles protein [Aphelenchoides avenae]|nr:rolling pebbles protein [Aphelenchus avenae]
MHAIITGHASTAALLTDRGCDITRTDKDGNSLLHLLARHPNKCLIDRLLDSGLSLESKNNEELRAVEVAILSRNQVAIDAFLRRGARLRSLTWQIAVDSDAEIVLILVRKLLDDASILFRRKRPTEALHRFHYALDKCSELLNEIDSSDEAGSASKRIRLSSIRPQLRQYKLQILYAIASVKRRSNEIGEAIELATEAIELAETDELRCQLHLLRAKCYFDGQNVSKATADAEYAASLRPDHVDVLNLLSVLRAPPPGP